MTDFDEIDLAGVKVVDRLRSDEQLAYVENESVHLLSAREPTPVYLADHGSWACELGWSPDGSELFFARGQCLRRIDIIGSRLRSVEGSPAATWHLSHAPDRQALFMKTRDMRVGVFDMAARAFRVLAEGVYQADCDWGAHRVLATRCGPKHGLILVDMQSGATDELGPYERLGDPRLAPGAGKATLQAARMGGRAALLTLPDRRLEPLTEGLCCFAWSPDGTAIAACVSDREVWLLDSEGQLDRRLIAATDETVGTRRLGYWSVRPAWSADGRLVAFGITSTRIAAERDEPLYQMNVQVMGQNDADLYARYRFTHWFGVFDRETDEVLLRPGHARGLTWRPR
jgi:hypothetical protein